MDTHLKFPAVAVLAAILCCTIAGEAAKSQTAEAAKLPLLVEKTPVPPESVQAGFFTPARTGQIWDSWMYYHEGKPEAGYWGYIVAAAKERNSLPAMMESRDGIKWEALPPAKTQWGATPPRGYLEYGGCERIGGKYYLIGGADKYMGSMGYTMHTYVADDPRGPFRPDAEAYDG